MAQQRYLSPEPGNAAHPYHHNDNAEENNEHDLDDSAGHDEVAVITSRNRSSTEPVNASMMAHGPDPDSIARSIQYGLAAYGTSPSTAPRRTNQEGLQIEGNELDPDLDNASRRKSKVSRACDECRRKKVRCDAATEQAGSMCQNCRRSGSECMFSRQPQKRGPSKGYIKELAERVSRLEYPRASPSESPYSHAATPPLPPPHAQDHAPPANGHGIDSGSRKRVHSLADATEAYAISAAEQVQRITQGMKSSSETNRSAQPKIPVLHPYISRSIHGHETFAPVKVDKIDLDRYYHTIHPLMPVLPDEMSVLADLLRQVDESAQTAFSESLHLVVNTQSLQPESAQFDAASRACGAVKSGKHGDKHLAQDLVTLIAYVFMAITQELCQHIWRTNLGWLGSAVQLAMSLRLHTTVHEHLAAYSSIEKTSRRVWLCLVTLDRWHAAGLCSETLIHDDLAQLVASDHDLVGSLFYHLIRISLTLGHLNTAFLHNPEEATKSTSEPSRVLSQLMRGEVSRVVESIQPLLFSLPTLTPFILHLQLLTGQSLHTTPPRDSRRSVDLACLMVACFVSSSSSSSLTLSSSSSSSLPISSTSSSSDPSLPSPHHFGIFDNHLLALAARSLVLARADSADQQAQKYLSLLGQWCDSASILSMNGPRIPSGWLAVLKEYISSAPLGRNSKSQESRTSDSDHEMVTEGEVPAPERCTTSEDWPQILKNGYLRGFD